MKKATVTLLILLSIVSVIPQNNNGHWNTNKSFPFFKNFCAVLGCSKIFYFRNSDIDNLQTKIVPSKINTIKSNRSKEFPQKNAVQPPAHTLSLLPYLMNPFADINKTIQVENNLLSANNVELSLYNKPYYRIYNQNHLLPIVIYNKGVMPVINDFNTSKPLPKGLIQKIHPPVSHPNLIKLTPKQKQDFIDTHNKWRSEVGVPPLVWSNNLENYASEWAIKNGKKNCKMEHRTDTNYGENLFWSSGFPFNPVEVVNSWGSEKDEYHDEVVGQSNAVVGHYTQIIWRTTTEVGCAAFQCDEQFLVVCNYNPAGNWVGQHPYK